MSEPIRILHIVSTIGIESGVAAVVMNYYRHIDKNKVQFDFIYFTSSENSYKEEIESLGGRVFFLPKPSITTYMDYSRFILSHTDEFEGIHLHEVYLNSILYPIIKKSSIKHFLVHSHSSKYSENKMKAVRNRILCLPIKKTANHFISCSINAGQHLYGSRMMDNNNVYLANNAIDVSRFRYDADKREKMRNELRLTNEFVIGHVGRFSYEKNHDFLLKIFYELLRIKPNARLLLIGSGDLQSDIITRINELGIQENIILLGRKKNIEDYMQAMDCFVLPSFHEGLPVVGVEAQTSDLPIFLSSNITREIDLIKAHYISLKESPKFWAVSIITNTLMNDRKDVTMQISDKGYDILIEARNLQNYYLSMSSMNC